MSKKVRYIGGWDTIALQEGKIYEVMSIEKGWYRIMTELDEDYLFPPKLFESIPDYEGDWHDDTLSSCYAIEGRRQNASEQRNIEFSGRVLQGKEYPY